MDTDDLDTQALGRYFATKPESAVTDDLQRLDNLVERAKGLEDTLAGNSCLGWRCANERCQRRLHVDGDIALLRCRACEVHATTRLLLDQLDALIAERHAAAELAQELRVQRAT